MARRKSRADIATQTSQLVAQAREQGNEARARRIDAIGLRYADNIRAMRFYRNARANFRANIGAPDAAYNRANARYDRAILRPVSRNSYMGLNEG